MNAQRAWERRFSLRVLLGWLAVSLLFVGLHLPATLRLRGAEAEAAPTDAATARTTGRRLGAPHPFEGWSGAADAADVLAEAAALPSAGGPGPATAEHYESTATRDLRRFAAAVASRDAGRPLSADDAGLFTRRPDLWLAFDAGRPGRPVDAREIPLWTRLLARRQAAVHAGHVFLAYLGLGAALLAVAAGGAAVRRKEIRHDRAP